MPTLCLTAPWAMNLPRMPLGWPRSARIPFRSSLPISAANKILERSLQTEYADAAKGG